MDEHRFRIVASWTSGRTGKVKCDSVPHALRFAAPPHFDGLEGRWTPEDLMLTAVASCFTSTFRALADYSKFEYADLEVEATGTVHKVRAGYAFKEIVTRPALIILREEDRERGLRLIQKTQDLCLVARALSVKHSLVPGIEVACIASAQTAKEISIIHPQSREAKSDTGTENL